MAKIVRFHKTGGPEVLQIDEVEVPLPGPGEVRIAVKAIGLNRAESMFRSGQYLETPVFPSRLGYEVSGIVDSVGDGVREFRAGDAVSTIPAFLQGKYGVYGELAVVPAVAVAKNPEGLDWNESTSIWMQYLTAYGALNDIARVQAGDFVVIPAASSSVGIAAIQIVNHLGAVPVALTRTKKKASLLQELGAKHVVATEEEDLVERIGAITGGRGARVTFDPVAGPYLSKLAGAASDLGIIIVYGVLSPEPTAFPLIEALHKSLTVRGYVLFEFTRDPVRLGAGKKFVYEGLKSGALKPIIAKVFEFKDIVAAHQYIESNQQIGKIVVKL